MKVSESGSIMFADAVEHHGPGRHVYTHRKRLGGEKNLHKS